MDRLIIENVRCFRGRHEVPLAPLTILVGENSTGKSTLLAMARLAGDVAAGEPEADFNEEPFLLGAYDQIASSLHPGDAAPSFSVGVGWAGEIPQSVLFSGEFSSHQGQPVLTAWRIKGASHQVDVEYRFRGHKSKLGIASLRLKAPSGEAIFDGDELPAPSMGLISQWATSALRLKATEVELPASREDVKAIEDLSYIPLIEGRPYAFSPIRTRPRRTYDPVQEITDPEGSHVPMVLASLSFEGGPAWDDLKREVDSFGGRSGLFDGFEVRRLGPSQSDPFQLQFRIGSATVNLVDIGYGVSQALPIVVDCLRATPGRTMLLQQPEVHLHPKAQAELGSFLAALAKQEAKRFLIETHSDYLVDRICMDVRDRKHGLRPEDVALLYFERTGRTVKIHHLHLDDLGNIQNAPPGYRAFFLEESRRFLGA